jgi:uncharacterized protein with GYD domain
LTIDRRVLESARGHTDDAIARRDAMPLYMTQFAYTPQAWSALAKNPADRRAGINAAAEKVGGKLVGLYYTFGDYDGIVLFEAPDDAAATGLLIGVVAPGHVSRTRTTRLLEVEEAMTAMRLAGTITYAAPGGD